MKALVAGWFSFEQMGATAGDLLARDLVCEWLTRAECAYDVALAQPFEGGVNWRSVEPQSYAAVVFVCGPFGNGEPIVEFLRRFECCRLIGLDLTMLDRLDIWNPFDFLWERDSSTCSRPDISFLSRHAKVPVVGVVLVHPQTEYRDRAIHQVANEAIARLVAAREISAVPIDTRLDSNSSGLRSPAEVESLIARMDLIITTRLHGLVLALKNGVPVIAIDPIKGGAKVKRQAETIGCPIVFTADGLENQALQEAFDSCLTMEFRRRARECGERAAVVVGDVQSEFISTIARLRRETGG